MSHFSPQSQLRRTITRTIFRKSKLYGRLSLLGVLGAIIFFWIVHQNSKLRQGLDEVLLTITSPVVQVLESSREHFIYLIELFKSAQDVKKENLRLKNTIQKLSIELQKVKRQNSTYNDLKTLLNVKGVKLKPLATVPVLSDLPHTNGRHMILQGGFGINLELDSYVVNHEGIVGRIVTISDDFSKIQHITDINARVPVMTTTTKHRGIMAGRNEKLPILEFLHKDPTNNMEPEEGELVLTSGDGGIYASNLPVGQLTRCQQEWCVKPFASNLISSYVMVFSPINNDRMGDKL